MGQEKLAHAFDIFNATILYLYLEAWGEMAFYGY
jgi:hypothetical protein